MTATRGDDVIEFPDEVVTRAPVRYVDLPGVVAPGAILTMDNGRDHTKPTTFGPQGLRQPGPRSTRSLGRDDSCASA